MTMIPGCKIIYEPGGRAKEYSPLAATLYRGCGHGCVYCYVPLATKQDRREFNVGAVERKEVLKSLEQDAIRLGERGENRPILFSFSTDPYNQRELDHPMMPNAIRVLHENGLQLQILTKAGMKATRDLDLLSKSDMVASSLTLLDDTQSLKWEPNAALPKSRIELVQVAKCMGLRTWVSFEPVIDPVQTLELMRIASPWFDLAKVGTINYCKTGTDWGKFGMDAIDLLKSLGKEYYIKDDLLKFLPGQPQHSTIAA